MASAPRTLPALLALVLLAAAPPAALARGGDDGGGGGGGGGGRPEVRVAGVCGRGATSRLRLRARDGAIEVEFEVDQNRSGRLWSVVVVHERRVAWRGRARTRAPSGSFSVERRVADFPGSDQVMARAVGPGGSTCQATASLPG
jgi:hypothetical protein